MHVVFKLYYMANNQKIADKKTVDYKEVLEKSRADSAARRPREKLCTKL